MGVLIYSIDHDSQEINGTISRVQPAQASHTDDFKTANDSGEATNELTHI